MSVFINFFKVILLRLRMAVEGVAAVFQIGVAILSAKGDGLKAKAAAALQEPRVQRLALRPLRAFLPNLVLSNQFVAAYPNTGTAVVTRYEDVVEVLDRNADFEVVYKPKMEAITGGENFFLGMQNTATYTRDVSNMRLAMRRDDVAAVVAPMASSLAAQLVAKKSNAIDVPNDLSLPVPTAIVTDYFGIDGAQNSDLVAWATLMFWYLFIDLAGDKAVESRALAAAAASRSVIDAAIASRKASHETKDDVLGRCLVLQQAGLPGMDDLGIRNNLIGLFIGAIPTISKACVQALDQLLDRPQALASAQAAARAGDDALFAAHVFEAFRFNPINPLIYRRAACDTKIAAGSLRSRNIPKGTMVLAVNLSAMFDPLRVEAPESFRTDRPWGDYMLWGYGMHACFGAYINRAVMPAILKPLLAKPGLRRAAGAAGQVDCGGTPFPQHLSLQWD
ncbi:MAG TPA: cytochrome P450 [Xanthobacteraceae bacterium]|nr:cytochrome P450 [Xanthobacteraceae bacterium]